METWDTAVSNTVSVADDFDRMRSTFIYEAPGFLAYQEGTRAPGAKCGDTIQMSGYRIGDTMLVTDAAVSARAAETPACTPVGTQKLAIIYARVPGLGAPPMSIEQLRTWVFSGDLSAPNFWSMSSFGLAPFSGDVIGPVDVDRQYGCNDGTAVQNAAYAAAAKLTDMTQYNRIFVAHPPLGSCFWGGVNSVGCRVYAQADGSSHRTSMGSMNSPNSLAGVQRYVFHEVGHGLGLLHSNAYIAPADTLAADRSRVTVLEYGDQYSAMGSGAASTYGLGQKEVLNWLKEGETIRTVSADIDVDLVPMGVGGSGLRGLKVKRKTQPDNEYVWVEYRTREGTDVNLPRLQPGAILHYTPVQVNLTGELLDATPGSVSDQSSYLDPVLPVGRRWQDPYSNLSIEVSAATPEKLSVSVRYAKPCASVTWPAQTMLPVSGGTFNAKVSADGDCTVVTKSNNYWIQPDGPGSSNFVASPNTGFTQRVATVTVDRQTTTVRQAAAKMDLNLDSIAPASGVLRAGVFNQFQLNILAPNGSGSIGEVRLLLGESSSVENACLLVYSGGRLRLMSNAGNSEAGSIRPNISESASNSQCAIATLSVANVSPSVVRLTFFVSPNATNYLGPKRLLMALRHAQDTQVGGYEEVGTMNVAAGCQAFFAPPRISVPGSGGVYFVTVNTAAGCAWEPAATGDWTRIAVNRGATASTATLTISANNTSSNRRATVTALGAEFIIDQLAAGQQPYPTVTFDGQELLISRSGGTGEVFFTTNLPAASISPLSDQPWLKLNYRLSPNGSVGSSVLYYVEANLTPAQRSATIRVGPTSLAVVQEAGPDDPGKNRITTLSGSGLAESGEAIAVTVARPTLLAFDRGGNLYITEPDYFRVRKVGKDGGISTVAGMGAVGEPLYGGPAGQSRLLSVRGVVVDSKGNVFIASSGNILRVDADGALSLFAIGLGSPQGMAIDDKDNIYVADASVNRVFIVRPDGTLTPFAGTGAAGYSGDGGAPLSALLRNPQSVAWASDGSVYISDAGNFAIRKVSAGRIESVIGTGTSGNTTDGNTAKGQQITTPGQVAVDAAGLVYWVTPANRVRYIDAAGKAATLAGGGTAAPADATLAASANLDVFGVAFDPTSLAEPLFALSDRIENAVRRVDGARKLVRLAGRDTAASIGDSAAATDALLYWPLFGVYGPDGLLCFSDSRNHRVRRINADGTVETIAGTGVRGFTGDGQPASRARLYEPSGLAFDAQGNLFIADSSNQRIRRIAKDGIITTVAGTGVAGSTGDNGPAAAARLFGPRGLAFDKAGTMFIADTNNGRIRAIDSTGQIKTVAGTGVFGYNGDDRPAESATLNSPQAVAVDSSDRLIIADSFNGRIRAVDAAGVITTVAGNGLSAGASNLARSTSLGVVAAGVSHHARWSIAGGRRKRRGRFLRRRRPGLGRDNVFACRPRRRCGRQSCDLRFPQRSHSHHRRQLKSPQAVAALLLCTTRL
ncbi:MAG: hypothetical protein HYZ37_19145 [Candidatus Solibacter usitatus]|nr:hypothetical protein [Candidatus Solibacter usitatus]